MSPQQRPKRSARTRRSIALAALSALVLGGALTAVALAAGSSLTLNSTANSEISETVVINGSGRTLYALSPETTHHLLCKSHSCFEAWPPMTVRNKSVKLKAGSGVHGTLALLHRSNGMWQVTLRGKPLYRFSGDEAKGEANGQGIKSFGGTWHAATASAAAATTPAPEAAPSMPAPPVYGY
jgi:predicted lipoprotein with Yx(FWY)xxD motif